MPRRKKAAPKTKRASRPLRRKPKRAPKKARKKASSASKMSKVPRRPKISAAKRLLGRGGLTRYERGRTKKNATEHIPRSSGPREFTTRPREFTTGPREFTTGPREFTTGPREFTTGPREFTTRISQTEGSPSTVYLGKQQNFTSSFQVVKNNSVVQLRYINGPVSFFADVLPTGQLVLLFGDWHRSKANMKEVCRVEEGCLHIMDFIKLWTRATRVKSELYLESTYVGVHATSILREFYYEKERYSKENVLVDIQQTFKKCLLNRMCPWSRNVFFNYLDIRDTDVGGIMLDELRNLNNGEQSSGIQNIQQVYLRFYNNLEIIFDITLTSTDIIGDFERVLSYSFILPGYRRKNESVVKVELESCSSQMRQKIYEYGQQLIFELREKYKKEEEFVKTDAHKQQLFYIPAIGEMGALLFDTYTLSRMFRLTNKSKVWLLYAGADHTRKIHRFLKEYMQAENIRNIETRPSNPRDPFSQPIRFVEVGHPGDALIRLL